MNEVFADTSGWANFFVDTEPYHAKAVMLMDRLQQKTRRVVTTNYVLSELLPLLTIRFRIRRVRALKVIEVIRSVPWVEIVHVDEALDAAAWHLLEKRLDKEWSLVDAVSFLVMENRRMTEALTTDKHFEQAGFIRLLRGNVK